MKKKISYLLFSALLCCCSVTTFCQNETTIPCDKLPVKPTNAVNDYANVIDDEAQLKMESKIRSYWDSTSIALAVVTVQNMDDNEVSEYALSVFRCWGVGGNGSNRGILFLMSMDERKLWITTGYGVEGILPDATCHKITESLVPLCKEGKYSNAVVSGVQQIFQTLGTMSWEERMKGIEAEKIKNEQKWADIKEKALFVICSIILWVLIIWLVRIIAKKIERKKLHAQVEALIVKMTKETLTASTKIDAVVESYKSQAKWALNEAQNHSFEAYGMLSKAQSTLEDAKSCYKEDSEKALRLIDETHRLIEQSFESFCKIDWSLKEKIKKFSTDAPIRLAAAKKQVSDAIASLSEFIASGYRLPQSVSEQQDYQKLIEEYEEKIEDSEFHQLIYTKSEIIRLQSIEAIGKILVMIQKRNEVAEKISVLVSTGKKRYEQAQNSVGIFDEYKSLYPESVWHQQEMLLKKLIAKLEPQRLHNLSLEIIDANSMAKQDFSTAAIKYDELENQINQAVVLCNAITTIGADQEKSKLEYPNKCRLAEEFVSKSLQKVKAVDVSSATRSKAKDTQRKLEEVKIQASRSILDWVLLINLLDSIKQSANATIRSAESDIRDAENEREEKERRERRRRNSESSSRNSNSYSSPYSSHSSSSDNSSSGFGGFSGGSSGGGGGGSDW